MSDHTVDFEDLDYEKGSMDTFQLASPSRLYRLEDLVQDLRFETTREIYEDDRPELLVAYAHAMYKLVQIERAVEGIKEQITGKYKARMDS